MAEQFDSAILVGVSDSEEDETDMQSNLEEAYQEFAKNDLTGKKKQIMFVNAKWEDLDFDYRQKLRPEQKPFVFIIDGH